MLKKILFGVVGLFLIGSIGLFFWARSAVANDFVRSGLAAQISEALGQPVSIGSIAVRLYPRVTVDLGTVTIGDPPRIHIETLHVGTNLRALLSRRIEHAEVRLSGARVSLPLPPLAVAAAERRDASGAGSAAAAGDPSGQPAGRGEGPTRTGPFTLVSIDEVVLEDVEIESGGRTIRADIEAVPRGEGAVLRRAMLTAGDTTVEVDGEIINLAGPVGNLSLTAGTVDLDRLLLFLGSFAAGAEAPGAAAAKARTLAQRVPARLDVSIAADRARSGGLLLEKLTGKAVATNDGVTLDPVSFGLFDGRFDGRLAVASEGSQPTFRGRANLTNIDTAALVAYAGSPGTISGRMNGRIDLAGAGQDLAAATRSARGTARVDVTDGVVPHLDLVRTAVLATSGRADSTGQAAAANTGGEKFSRLGATLAIAGGQARTNDLTFESPDVRLAASGSVALDGTDVNLAGLIQLSEALSAQAGRDLVRYTAEGGRVTLPAKVTGPPSELSVQVDVANLAERAIRNKATDEINKALERNLGNLFKRPPK